MEDLKNKAENLTGHLNLYFETAYKVLMLHVTKKTVNVASSGFIAFFVSVLFLFVILFSGLGLSWWIGSSIDSVVGGLFIVAGIFVLLITTLLLLKKKYIFPIIRNYLIKSLYE